jgi:hypothetical protein
MVEVVPRLKHKSRPLEASAQSHLTLLTAPSRFEANNTAITKTTQSRGKGKEELVGKRLKKRVKVKAPKVRTGCLTCRYVK